jgi:glycosyltransferase involved in cell wall biosynthesis
VHVGFALLTLFPGRVGGSETNVRGLLDQFADGKGPERLTVLANRHVMRAYPGFERGPVTLHEVRSYRPGDRHLTRALAMAAARALPRRASRDVPTGLDVVHYPVTVPLPATEAPRVVTVFDLQHHDLAGFFSRAERLYRRWAYDEAAREADLVVTTSAFSANRLAERVGVARERIEVVPMGIDRVRFTPEPGEHDADTIRQLDLQERFVVYPANLWPHKNHMLLLEAFARGRERTLGLVLTGQTYGRLDELLGQARELGVADQVRHLGHLPHTAVPALYRRAVAMLFPSLYEGFGAPPLEAMACGCPVAASNRGSLPEVCGEAALLFNGESGDEMVEAMERITSDEPLRDRLREAGLRRARTYTWHAAASRHRSIYARAAATRTGRP